ncbi:MAG TPA: DUF1549 domain-containing protein [Planctomycetota bacterium]|nr:DUF1549 domain-containing protein [Planctomycetota bacterium]
MLRRLVLLAAFCPFALAFADDATSRVAAPAAGEGVPDFATEVLPILTRIGCNSGQCHGAAGGQNGFALSLRGYDPIADYDAIARERAGRRIDVVDAERSLLLRKPSMKIKHKGGRKLPEGSESYETIHRWIAAGAPGPGPGQRTLVALEPQPKSASAKPGQELSIRVTARFSDGTSRDVTDLALFSSNDDGVARAETGGLVHVDAAGEAAVLVRFLNGIAAVRVSVPFAEPRAFDAAAEASRSAIDRLVDAKLAAMGIPPSPAADDGAFLRRVSLDLCGKLPTPDETRAYVADRAPEKRSAAVRRLLASPAAVAHWSRWLGDLLRVRDETMTAPGATSLDAFVRASLAARKPMDALVRELLVSQGDPAAPGPAAFSLATPGPKEQMEFVTRTFLGVRLQCAQCHQHPFDRWSRADYFGAASFFSRVRREDGKVRVVDFGELTDPRTGGDAKPALPGGEAVSLAGVADRRSVFADWLLEPETLRFDRSLANRVWKQLFGRGLVEPADDLREGNPPSNPELLELLARSFRDGGRDLFRLVELCASSDAYARSPEPVAGNERDERYASHALARPLPAAVLLDAIADATGATPSFPQAPMTKRAAELADDDGGSTALRVFGRCPRDGSTDPAAIAPPGVPAALHLLHGPPASSWLSAPGGRVASLRKRALPAHEAVEELFLATLARRPSTDEAAAARDQIGARPTAEALEDVLWALVASTEFSFNH